MKKGMFSKKSVGASLFLALLFTLSLFVFGCSSSTVASAASGNVTFDGVWTGEATSGAMVVLTLQPKIKTLQYGVPRNCVVTLETPIIVDEHNRKYGITTANGGFCKNMEFGKLLLKLGDDGQSITYEAKSTDGASQDKGTLRRTGK
jgi:hypothetical protein